LEEAAQLAPKGGPTSEVPPREVMMKGPAQQGPPQMEGSTVPIRDKPAQLEVAATDALSSAEGIHANEAEPRPEDVHLMTMLQPPSPREARVGTWWQAASA
jgi:hypothetical protein